MADKVSWRQRLAKIFQAGRQAAGVENEAAAGEEVAGSGKKVRGSETELERQFLAGLAGSREDK